MLKIEEIKRFIDEDKASHKKLQAKIGRDYYEGKHDILNYKLYYFDAEGNLVEDKSRSNIKIPHPFFTELVDQCTQYIFSGRNPYVKSDIPELQKELDVYFNYNDDFNAELLEVITGCQTKGFEYMYAYRNSDNKLSFQCADSMGVIEVDRKYTDDNIDYIIYWYKDREVKNNRIITKIQVWDSKETYYYVDTGDNGIVKDETYEVNPRPHVLYRDGVTTKYKSYEGLGYIPFFRFDNCKQQTNNLQPIKELIDDYDLMACGLSNNLQDASEYLVVVKGFQGDNLEELIHNVKTKKHIGVNGDDGGGVEFKTVDIPYQARVTKLELDEKNIYRFGMGFNSAQIGDGNITNVVIKSRYALLDLKSNKLEVRLKQFLKKLVNVVIDEINKNNKTAYKSSDVYFDFKREIITNASDNAQIEQVKAQTEQVKINTLLNLAQTLDGETVLKSICEVLEIDYEEIKNKIPRAEEELIDSAMDELND